MDFFARQAAARRESRLLVATYFVAVACVLTGADLVVAWVVSHTQERGNAIPVGTAVLWSTVLLGGFMLSATLYKVLLLRGGGSVVALDLGGARVDPGTSDPLRRRLLNVVEEMAIASGVPVPEVYVLEREIAINALSAGYAPADAAIVVTSGMLKHLNREQLQAVVAHEFSHVLNGDVRLSTRLLGLNFGLLVLALIGRFILSAGRGDRRGKGAGGLALVGVALVVLGYLGLLFGRLLQAMISRRRERLADASAVQFTRNAGGLAGALVRAAAQKRSSRLHAADAEEVAHMLFFAASRRWLLATHPPVLERLQALDPAYDAERLDREMVALQISWDRETADEQMPRRDTPPLAIFDHIEPTGLVAGALAASVGDPQPLQVARARALRRALPELLQRMAGVPDQATAFVLALLLSTAPAVRAAQRKHLAGSRLARLAASTEEFAELAASLPAEQRLPAVQKLFPALRQLPQDDQLALIDDLRALSLADDRLEVFEFALSKLVAMSLVDALQPRPPHGSRRLDERQPQLALLFAVMAHEGAADEPAARHAYGAGMGVLFGSRWPDYRWDGRWPGTLGPALDDLRDLQPAAKELLLEGLGRTVSYDGEVRIAEAELLRTVCGVLQCPLPPILSPGSAAASQQVRSEAPITKNSLPRQ